MLDKLFGPRARILVIDDDEATRDVICTALDEHGYGAIPAANGADALDLMLIIGEQQPHLILLDLHMPSLDGRHFAHEYRLMPEPRAPLIVMSGLPEAAEVAAEIQADGLLPKPFDLADLIDLVEERVGRPAPTR